MMSRFCRILSVVLFLNVALSAEAKFLSFPGNFQWCVATSSHQIEGDNVDSDWWDWEHLPGKIKNGDISGKATDHWNHLEEDVGLMKSLGLGTYRFSVEWAKIEPREGEWNYQAIDRYRRLLFLLKANNIQPLVTLHHFTFPRWVAQNGGWEWSRTPEVFERFVRFVEGEFNRDGLAVRDWVTINEPTIVLTMGYVVGVFPPGHNRDIVDLNQAMAGMLRSHARAYAVLHEGGVRAGLPIRVGMAHHLRIFDPASIWNLFDRIVAKTLDQAFNWSVVEALETGHASLELPGSPKWEEEIPGLKGTQDFIGLNYYGRDVVKYNKRLPVKFESRIPKGAPLSDMGWEIYPEGFYRMLKKIAKKVPGRNVIVTENGVADAVDSRRAHFIEEHLAALHKALDEGVAVEGYCHWSLLDNFEWAEGFTPRFGLYEVNYQTFARTPRASALRYAEIIHSKGLDRPVGTFFKRRLAWPDLPLIPTIPFPSVDTRH